MWANNSTKENGRIFIHIEKSYIKFLGVLENNIELELKKIMKSIGIFNRVNLLINLSCISFLLQIDLFIVILFACTYQRK